MHISSILIITALTTVLTAHPAGTSKHKRGISKSGAQHTRRHSRNISTHSAVSEHLAEMVMNMALEKENENACMETQTAYSAREAKTVQDQTPEQLSGMMETSTDIIPYGEYLEATQETEPGPQSVNFDLSQYQAWMINNMWEKIQQEMEKPAYHEVREKMQREMEKPEYHNKAMDTLGNLMQDFNFGDAQ